MDNATNRRQSSNLWNLQRASKQVKRSHLRHFSHNASCEQCQATNQGNRWSCHDGSRPPGKKKKKTPRPSLVVNPCSIETLSFVFLFSFPCFSFFLMCAGFCCTNSKNIKAVAKQPNVFDLLAQSLAPSIYGHDKIKVQQTNFSNLPSLIGTAESPVADVARWGREKFGE